MQDCEMWPRGTRNIALWYAWCEQY